MAHRMAVLRNHVCVDCLGPLLPIPVNSSPLSEHEIAIVQESWATVKTVGGSTGHAVTKDIFYPELLKTPEVAALFKNTDMPKQATALWNMLGAGVDGLSDLGKLVPVLKALGKGHVKYGVKDEHYPIVGASLIYTLKTGLGDGFTPELQAAWVKVYGIISETMKAGARE